MTGEAGEPTRGTPRRKGERRDTGLLEGKTTETPLSDTVSTKLQRIAGLAREAPERAFLSLAHHIDVEFLHEAFRRTRKDGAVGVDGQTAKEYEERLEENLGLLLDRFKSGRYKAPPVRRTYIPKGDGKERRPIGIPTFEDKLLQRAVVMVLEAVYEQDFLPCSYGYRPNCSAHAALAELGRELTARGGGWVIEVDIKGFFDNLSHCHLREFLDQRVRDGVLRRTIDKWLAAGVMEGTEWSQPDAGTPQGGVISPLLANVYLHEVIDQWFERTLKPRLRGWGFMIRYADDMVMVFANEPDARRAMEVLPKRLGRYGLTLHPTKTRLLHFRPQAKGKSPTQPGSRSFDFLGFTHYWGRNRWGRWVVKPKTAGDRFSRALRRIYLWLRNNRHQRLRGQHAQLVRKLQGHDNYYGITHNYAGLARFRNEVMRAWKKWLSRRSRAARMTWDHFNRVVRSRFPLPKPVVRHRLWPSAANPCA